MASPVQPDYQALLIDIAHELEGLPDPGAVASYIPELGTVNPDQFGVHLVTLDQRHHALGDAEVPFSIQSISKVFSLALVFERIGPRLWERVDVEPSGTPFNSLVQLEHENGIPRNPLINAGALVVSDLLVTLLPDPKQAMLAFIRSLAGTDRVRYNPDVAESEKATGYRNEALIHLMKAYGNIHNDISGVMDVYCYLCAIEMTCRELAQAFAFLAANGINPLTGHAVVSPSKSKRINAIMQLCGFYDEAGEFSFKVGLPGKSGVGGGIIAVHPGRYSVAVWSPRLNPKGNSYRGMRFLEALTTKAEASVF